MTEEKPQLQPTDPKLELDGKAMYPRELTTEGKLKHPAQCQGAFGRYDPRCYRCLELLHGSAPRKSGHEAALVRKRAEGQRRLLF